MFEQGLGRARLGFPLVTTTLKEFDQFALRTGVELLLPWFHLRRPPSRTSWQDYRRCRLHILRHGCLLSQLPAPEQKSTRVAQKITPLSQQFSSPQPPADSTTGSSRPIWITLGCAGARMWRHMTLRTGSCKISVTKSNRTTACSRWARSRNRAARSRCAAIDSETA